MIDQMESSKNFISKVTQHPLGTIGPLAQSAERGADNAKVMSSTLTRTILFCVR